MPRHDHTDVSVTGAAHPSARAKSRLWDLALATPKWAPPVAPPPRVPADVAVALELRTAKALARLSQRLAELVREHGGPSAKIRALTFERWRFAALQEESAATSRKAPPAHPVIPSGANCDQANKDLATELRRQGVPSEAAAVTVVAALAAEAKRLHALLASRAHRVASGQTCKGKPLAVRFNLHSVQFVCEGRHVRCSLEAYGKLAVLHRRHAPADECASPLAPLAASAGPEDMEVAETSEASAAAAAGESSPRTALHARLFTLLLRYKSLGGHGFQAAIGAPVWQLLTSTMGVGVECFASPLNAFLPTFGSAFADVDAAFGSRGSFFKMRPLSGSYACNPPFVHGVMDAAAGHILELMAAAAAAPGGPALSFVVILPGWQEGASYKTLTASPFLRAKILIAAADHGFCDGASHQRQDPYRHSPFDTAVLILQTDKASRKWPAATGTFESALRRAFGACVPSETAVARQVRVHLPHIYVCMCMHMHVHAHAHGHTSRRPPGASI